MKFIFKTLRRMININLEASLGKSKCTGKVTDRPVSE